MKRSPARIRTILTRKSKDSSLPTFFPSSMSHFNLSQMLCVSARPCFDRVDCAFGKEPAALARSSICGCCLTKKLTSSFCAQKFAHELRLLPQESTAEFAAVHNLAVGDCLSTLLQAGPLPAQGLGVARLPLRLGGLGLRPTAAVAPAAYLASWADSLPVFERHAP